MIPVMQSPEDVAEVREAFDAAAERYDAAFDHTAAGRRLRRIVGDILLDWFRPGESILELNSGTGTDAVLLASHGIRVHATDLSPLMVRQTERKAAQLHLRHLVSTEVLSIDEVGRLRGRTYDGLLSNMGGLNCVEDLRELADQLAPLIRPGGYAVLGFMPDFSLWETAAFILRGRWTGAFRRLDPAGCLASVQGIAIRVFYHSPADVKRAFAEYFDHISTNALNVITPPPGSPRAREIIARAAPVLEAVEDRLARIPPLNRIGDHCLMVLRRTSRQGGGA